MPMEEPVVELQGIATLYRAFEEVQKQGHDFVIVQSTPPLSVPLSFCL